MRAAARLGRNRLKSASPVSGLTVRALATEAAPKSGGSVIPVSSPNEASNFPSAVNLSVMRAKHGPAQHESCKRARNHLQALGVLSGDRIGKEIRFFQLSAK